MHIMTAGTPHIREFDDGLCQTPHRVTMLALLKRFYLVERSVGKPPSPPPITISYFTHEKPRLD